MLIGGLVLLSYIKIRRIISYEEKIKLLPEFELTDINGSTIINHNNILSDRRTLLVFFYTQCDYCTHELTMLNNERHRLFKSNVILFSEEPPEDIHQYMGLFNFDECENVFIGRANRQELYGWFGKLVPPTSYIYDEQLQLVEKHLGSHDIETIIKALEKEESQ